MNIRKTSAVATLKQFGLRSPQLAGAKEPNLIAHVMKDKDYSLPSIIELAKRGVLGSAFTGLVIRDSIQNDSAVVNYFAQVRIPDRMKKTYSGTPEENKAIDLAASIGIGNQPNNRIGVGIARNYQVSVVVQDKTRKVPILVVGYGAAGVLIQSQLRALGFTNITVMEKANENLGIWSREDVFGGSRNNPFDINLSGSRFLAQAPGEGSDVRDALSSRIGSMTKSNVIGIRPGQLSHRVSTNDSAGGTQGEQTFPIVINCIGLGKPVPLSDPSRMKTSTSATEAKATRWQKRIKQQEMKGKLFILIGLGNSTAEMLRQIHKAQDEGIDVDYRVFTHYSYDSVMNPDDMVPLSYRQARRFTRSGITPRKGYRVFRDLSASNLTSYQGDLPLSRYDYYRALSTRRILSDITSWNVFGKTMEYARRQKTASIRFDHFYHLSGYRHNQESLEVYGCAWDKKQRGPKYDYDGELQDEYGQRFKGYFGFGSVLESEWNKNATVIPGMVYRIGDLIFSIIMRATEYSINNS